IPWSSVLVGCSFFFLKFFLQKQITNVFKQYIISFFYETYLSKYWAGKEFDPLMAYVSTSHADFFSIESLVPIKITSFFVSKELVLFIFICPLNLSYTLSINSHKTA